MDCCCSVRAPLALCFFAYCKYERWLAKKLNPYVVAYQSDHNLENLKQGLNRCRFPGISANIPKISLQRTGSPLCWNNSAGQKRKKLWSSFCIEKKIRRIKRVSPASGRLRKGNRRYQIRGTGTTSKRTAKSLSWQTKRENQEYPQTPKRVNIRSFAGSLSALVWHCSESSAI